MRSPNSFPICVNALTTCVMVLVNSSWSLNSLPTEHTHSSLRKAFINPSAVALAPLLGGFAAIDSSMAENAPRRPTRIFPHVHCLPPVCVPSSNTHVPSGVLLLGLNCVSASLLSIPVLLRRLVITRRRAKQSTGTRGLRGGLS